ncbi:MAG: phenylalanine--tRNA ligase subunit beta [Acidobacteria bacterium]|nr:phenylalanine--tRNA ligase subunit beta [Acidobacteriota bacterium]
MKVLYSWLRDFVDVADGPAEVGRRLSLRGLALEGIEPAPPGDAAPGQPAIEGDAVLDFDVTANRPDCMSVVGIAREIAAVYRLPLRLPAPDAPSYLRAAALAKADRTTFSVTLDAPELCPRYVGAGATVKIAPSPGWMQRRLLALGVRPISNVVDVTNYVLLELGQPMHAFDHTRLAGNAIVVRTARAGEGLTTLDGKARTLSPAMLVIADAERAAAIGGVMGGLDSEVHAGTTRIVFESAWFTPGSVRATSKALGLRSEASMRFERGADPTGAALGMARACALLEFIGAGTADGTMVDQQARPFERRLVPLRHDHVEGLLGMPVPIVDVERILAALGFTTAAEAAGSAWSVAVPGWRPDIARPEDLIEEVGRHYGFEHLPATFPPVHQAPPPSDARIARDAAARRAMLAMGFSEAISFAFIEAAAAAAFSDGGAPIALANPLSETFAVMRPSVLAGVVDAVSHNRRHGRRDVRLFEIATAFGADGERRSLAAAWTGDAAGEHWSGGGREVDFFDLKGAVEQVGAALGVALAFELVEPPYLVAGRAAGVLAGARSVGVCGLLSPSLADARGIPRADGIYVLELNLDAMAGVAPPGATRVVPLPRFPAVVRDVSLLVDDSLSSATVRDTIRHAAPATLVSLREFDRYQGRGVPVGKVSVSLRLTFRADDRTLTDEEVGTAMTAVLAATRSALNAEQR